MTLTVDQEAGVLLLLFARVGSITMLMPMLGDESVPRQIRLLFAVGLTFAMSGMLRPLVGGSLGGGFDFAGAVLAETATGLAIGALARVFFQAAVMAGSIVSLQMGLTTALVFDPALGGQTPLLGKLVGVGATLFCFALGLHGWWFGAIVRSYAAFPPGSVSNAAVWADLAVTTVGQAMTLAVSLAAPFLIFGIVFNLALGVAGRLAPSIQFFFIAQPLLIFGGLALLAATAGAMMTAFGDAFHAWLSGGWLGG